ncbi:hypothetical protein, partial [Streptomyces rimosus]
MRGAGNALGDLAHQLRADDPVVPESDDQARAANGPVRGPPVPDHLKAQLAADTGEIGRRRHLEDVQPVVTVTPDTDYVDIDVRATTVAAGGANALTVEREHGTNDIVVSGTTPVG